MSRPSQLSPLPDLSSRSSWRQLAEAPAWLGHTNFNRFLMLDLRERPGIVQAGLHALATAACARPFVDDLIVLDAALHADCRFRVFGGDGREGDFCGNGALFAVSRLWRPGQDSEVTLDTRAGPFIGAMDASGRSEIELGRVRPLRGVFDARLRSLIRGFGAELLGAVSAGEPHLVLDAPPGMRGGAFRRSEFERFAAPLCDAAPVAGGANVTMVVSRAADHVEVRTFERGARRMTASCGSGAVAAAAVVFGHAPLDWNITVASPGGWHGLSRRHDRDRWWLSGEPRETGRGRVSEFLDLETLEGGSTPARPRRASSPTRRVSVPPPAGRMAGFM